ncbi:MAG: RsiV family protein [Spirochaetaceae bacterium]|nr:RsiV family protein [Spirochaetaceae bacterium]
MKFVFLSAILVSALVLNSCAGKRSRENGPDLVPPAYSTGWYVGGELSSNYVTYSKKEVVPLFPEKENGPKLDFFVDTLDVLDQAERKMLRDVLYDGLSCQDYADNVYNNIKSEYLKTKESAAAQPGESYNRTYRETFDGAVYPSFIVVSRSYYYLSGGAHGQNEKAFFVLDRETLSKVELIDILRAGAENDLRVGINDALRARYHVEPGAPLTSAGFLSETANVPRNFFISREGLGFCWNPYEISPYSMGTLEVVLPYARIEKLLNDKGFKMFKNL